MYTPGSFIHVVYESAASGINLLAARHFWRVDDELYAFPIYSEMH